MIHKLISHTNPIDQKHSFGRFCLQAPYLNDMNNSNLAGSIGVEGEETQKREVRGEILGCSVQPQLTRDGDDKYKIAPTLKA